MRCCGWCTAAGSLPVLVRMQASVLREAPFAVAGSQSGARGAAPIAPAAAAADASAREIRGSVRRTLLERRCAPPPPPAPAVSCLCCPPCSCIISTSDALPLVGGVSVARKPRAATAAGLLGAPPLARCHYPANKGYRGSSQQPVQCRRRTAGGFGKTSGTGAAARSAPASGACECADTATAADAGS